ncbi:MAG TPA: thioredoxin domain-containing protein [Bryobacteraceae bacterium]|nr:thioredoxin domain-containing protein [Bryobacteraceae bacterium]
MFLGAVALSFTMSSMALQAQTSRTAVTIDSKLLFHYVKYMERWPADAELTVGTPKASMAMPGLFEVIVQRTRMGRVVSQRLYYATADGTHFLKGDTFAIHDKPFDTKIAILAQHKSPSIGPKDAGVTLDAFEDFQCADCADDAKVLKELLPLEFGKQIRVVFHDYPLVQHKWAMPAAIAGRCAFRSGDEAFWKYYSWVFSHRGEIDENNFAAKANEWAKTAGLGTKFASCLANRETESEVNASIADGLALEVQGTPTLFLNGRMLPMLFPNGQMVPPDTQFPALKWMIQFELKVIPPADACCMVVP